MYKANEVSNRLVVRCGDRDIPFLSHSESRNPSKHLSKNQLQKQPFRGVIRKSCSENVLQIYRRKFTLRHGCFAVNSQRLTPFPKNTSQGEA